ncbi:MAG TPA: DNA repair protein RecO [Negativicutes bacterium]|nr:DNA repair protein RecO [Negativicutes bacterium]
MSIHHKATGFVFKKEDRLEADRVFSVFTREFGRLEIFGKGIRKIASKLKGGMEIFRIAEIEFVQGKTKKTLTDAAAMEKFKTIAQSPEKMEIAAGICGLVEDFIKGEQKDEVVFGLLQETFAILEAEEARQLIYFYFFWNFVSLLGYAPDLSRISPDTAGLIRVIKNRNWPHLAALETRASTQKSLKEISGNYHYYLLGHTR